MPLMCRVLSPFLNLSHSLIQILSRQRLNLPPSLPPHGIFLSFADDNPEMPAPKETMGCWVSLSAFLERTPESKFQQECVCRCFSISRTRTKEGAEGLQFTFGLFTYTLTSDSPARVLLSTPQQARTAKPTLLHLSSLWTWPPSCPTVKPVGLPPLQSQALISLLEFPKRILILPLSLRHRSAAHLSRCRSVLPSFTSWPGHVAPGLNLSFLTCKIMIALISHGYLKPMQAFWRSAYLAQSTHSKY